MEIYIDLRRWADGRDPRQQGLKQHRLQQPIIIAVADGRDPRQQGLKLVTDAQPARGGCRADGRDPRQQGLKLASRWPPQTRPDADGRDPRQQGLKRDHMQTTLVKDEPADGRDPRQQGLKLIGSACQIIQTVSRWARSTTTRIETSTVPGRRRSPAKPMGEIHDNKD